MLTCLLASLAISPIGGQKTYSFDVHEAGHGRPLILIPGLTCDGRVWDRTVDHLKSRYRCYVLSLPGFAGRPPIAGRYIPRVRDEIISFVRDRHLRRPAVMGHSLGGFLTLSLGSAEPDLFGPLISVDGLPFMGAVFDPTATAESTRKTAEAVAKGMTSATPSQFKQQIKAALAAEISDPKNVDALYPSCSSSDPADVAEAMKELMSTDLRANIAKIKSPLLVIGVGGWLPSNTEALRKSYALQLTHNPRAKFEFDSKARHFVMLDDPEFFFKTVDGFLDRNH